jgi:hypothetical protein
VKGTSPIKYSTFSYVNVETDDDGWADAKRFRPADYDLVYFKVEGVKKTLSGWCHGSNWDGLGFKSEYKVICWKRNFQDHGAVRNEKTK